MEQELYLIDTPPPTISGNLHIGHIFSYTQGDIIASYQKYLGKELIYPFCFDNNGLPTQKLAAKKKIKTTEEIIDFSIKKSLEYSETFKASGIEFANHQYHTFDEKAQLIAKLAFEKLKENGIAYKAETEFLWCPIQNISISQSELDDEGKISATGEFPIKKKGIGWFIDIKNHLPQIKEKINSIDWKPLKYKQRALDWCDNIQWDWSISRERNFGIRIPDDEQFTFDTWFISSLSPQLAYSSYIGEATLDIPIFDLRFQSHDIIRSWAFYTIAMSYFLSNQIPWKTIMITGHSLDGSGNKESKSSGNATMPKPLIDKHKPCGIREWSTSTTLGTDTKIDEDKMKMGWRLRNKFDNARKFIQYQIANNYIGEDETLFPIWDEYKIKILAAFDKIELDKAQKLIYEFFWLTFCDKWIEESKSNAKSLTLEKILDDLEPIFKIIYK